MIWLLFVVIFNTVDANILPDEEIVKNSLEIKRLKTEVQSVVQTIVRIFFNHKYKSKVHLEPKLVSACSS